MRMLCMCSLGGEARINTAIIGCDGSGRDSTFDRQTVRLTNSAPVGQ